MTRATCFALLLFSLAAGCGDYAYPGDVDAAETDALEPDARTDAVPPDAPDAALPTCSVSAPRIVFDDGSSPTNEVYIAALDGTLRAPLAPHAMADYAVTGSPFGKVAFTTNRDGNLEVYTVLADGTGLQNLTMNASPDGNPVFSRDGTKIAFARSGALFVMNADGTNQHAVAAGNAYQPRWSHDGTLLAFELSSGGSESDLWIVNEDGSGLRQLTNYAGYEGAASWSPSGAQIAFQWQQDIHVINADGTGRVNLTNDAAMQFSPAWSPDGTKIAISDDGDIKTIPPAGGSRTPLSSGTDTDGIPVWSPDGTKIMFPRLNSPTNSTRRIVVANADGTNAMVWGGPTNYVNSMAWVACP